MKFLKKKKDILSSRGFNLFSSVVAAVLVMSAVVLVNTLISTEEKTTNQVSLMVNSFELSDAASLARADALQSFNYYFRERMETWLTCQYSGCIAPGGGYEEGFPILNMNNYDNWDQIKKSFEQVVLLEDPSKPNNFDSVVVFIANKTIDNFDTRPYGRYTVSLSDTSQRAKDALKEGMSAALRKAREENKDFIEVVDCDGQSSCNTGTFYFNVDLSAIDNATYEALPRIVVRDTISGEEIKTAILPRTNLRIYVPLRFFKVIYEADQQAQRIAAVDSSLQNVKLGFCDSGCAPRTNALTANNDSSWDKQCPLASQLVKQTLTNATLSLYDPGGSNGPNQGLQASTRYIICSASAGVGEINENGFANYNFINGGLKPPAGETPITNCYFEDISASPHSYATKTIVGGVQGVPLNCTQMDGSTSSIIYQETNPLYVVSGDKLLYKIKISTGQYSVTPPFSLGSCKNGTSPDSCTPA